MPTNDHDDELLRALGDVARDQADEPSEEELARLAREAETDPRARALLDALAPLDAAAHDRVAAHVAAHLTPAVVEVRPARWRRHAGAALGGLALAAALALFVGRTGPDDVPSYAITSSGVARTRGPGDEATRCALRASDLGSFEVHVRPESPATGSVDARVFLVRGDEPEPFGAAVEISPQGAVRVVDENRRLVGARELVVVVGRASAIGDARSKAAGRGVSGRGWQALRCAVE